MIRQSITVPIIADESADRIDRFYDLVAPRLQLVEEELRKDFDSEVRTIKEVGEHILDGGGKRLRPILLLLSADLVGYRGSEDVAYAAVVELIHTASLVHDDIIDEASVRRGRTSINFRWGNDLTVLVGDYLYSYAMQTALAIGNLEVLRLLSTTTIRMTEGEIIALETNGRTDLRDEEYFGIVGRKTAELFGAACRIPAMLVGLPEKAAQSLYDYGYNLGVCFQLVDDLLDFTSSTEVLGKPALSDLKEGKMTLPLILTLPRASEGERRSIERIAAERAFGTTPPGEIVAMVERHGAIERTREIAREFAHRARIALNGFDASPARDALAFGLEFVLTRDR